MMKRILTTLLALTILISTFPVSTHASELESYVDIINPATFSCVTIRGERIYYDPDGKLKKEWTNLDGTVTDPRGDVPKFHNGTINGKYVGDTDYPYEQTYYYFGEDVDATTPEQFQKDVVAHGYTSYEDAIKDDRAKQTISYRFFLQVLNTKETAKWDEDVSHYVIGNLGEYVITPSNLKGFVNASTPTKTYFYSAYGCECAKNGCIVENDPCGYHVYHTYLSFYDYYADFYSEGGYIEPSQDYISDSPIYATVDDLKDYYEKYPFYYKIHPTEVQPLGNYSTVTAKSQERFYIEPHRFSKISDPYTGNLHYKENYTALKWRMSNPIADLSSEVDVPKTDKEEKIVVGGVNVNKKDVVLNVNESATVTASVVPSNATDQTLTWKSNNEKVASVNNGVIKGNTVGKTTVVVSSSNNKTAVVNVTVKSQEQNKKTEDVENTYVVQNNEVECTDVEVKNGKVVIPDTVKVNGKTYKVTTVSSKMIKNPKSVKSIVLGKNVTVVKSGAFSKCTNLKTVEIKSSKVTIQGKAFNKKVATVKFTNKKLSKVKIAKNAFKKTVKVQCKSKKAKTVLKKAFKSYKSKVTVK